MDDVINYILVIGVGIVIFAILMQPKTSLVEDYQRSIDACNHNPACIQEINEGFKNMGYAIEGEVDPSNG